MVCLLKRQSSLSLHQENHIWIDHVQEHEWVALFRFWLIFTGHIDHFVFVQNSWFSLLKSTFHLAISWKGSSRLSRSEWGSKLESCRHRRKGLAWYKPDDLCTDLKSKKRRSALGLSTCQLVSFSYINGSPSIYSLPEYSFEIETQFNTLFSLFSKDSLKEALPWSSARRSYNGYGCSKNRKVLHLVFGYICVSRLQS